MDHEITKQIPLLKKDGTLTEPGWARTPMFLYDRKAIRANAFRIKEWDYYAILNTKKQYAIAATISDLGYAGLFSISFTDFKEKKSTQVDSVKMLTFHHTGLAASSGEDSYLRYFDDKMVLSFIKKGNKRRLIISAPTLVLPNGDVGLKCELTLTQSIKMESINIATSWKEKKTAFYLNEKVVGMPCSGSVRSGAELEELERSETFGILDWGRGRWTYRNRWYWASGCGMQNGKNFGFNFGYGFSDRSMATENALFLDGVLYKVHEMKFEIEEDHAKPWIMKDGEGLVNLVFTPIAPRTAVVKVGPIHSDQKQYFGFYNGTVKIDGTPFRVENLMGFAEDVYNRY
jgi:Protein of unknown function (DUF2804).